MSKVQDDLIAAAREFVIDVLAKAPALDLQGYTPEALFEEIYNMSDEMLAMAQLFEADSAACVRLVLAIKAAEGQPKDNPGEIERLRAALGEQVTGWTEVLKLDVLPEREYWAAQEVLASANKALKGGAK